MQALSSTMLDKLPQCKQTPAWGIKTLICFTRMLWEPCEKGTNIPSIVSVSWMSWKSGLLIWEPGAYVLYQVRTDQPFTVLQFATQWQSWGNDSSPIGGFPTNHTEFPRLQKEDSIQITLSFLICSRRIPHKPHWAVDGQTAYKSPTGVRSSDYDD